MEFVKDLDLEDLDVWWKIFWKEILVPRKLRMKIIYLSIEFCEIWEIGMDVYFMLWGYKVGDDEIVAKWFAYKVGDFVSWKVKFGLWYKSLVDLEECEFWCLKNGNTVL